MSPRAPGNLSVSGANKRNQFEFTWVFCVALLSVIIHPHSRLTVQDRASLNASLSLYRAAGRRC